MRCFKVLCAVFIIAGLLLPAASYGQAAKFRIGCALPLTGRVRTGRQPGERRLYVLGGNDKRQRRYHR